MLFVGDPNKRQTSSRILTSTVSCSNLGQFVFSHKCVSYSILIGRLAAKCCPPQALSEICCSPVTSGISRRISNNVCFNLPSACVSCVDACADACVERLWCLPIFILESLKTARFLA